MRCTQFVGLTEKAESLLAREEPCKLCGLLSERFKLGKSRGATTSGMFDEPVLLKTYVLARTGEEVFEAVQFCEWASGPVIATALRFADGTWVKDSLWTCAEYEKLL